MKKCTKCGIEKELSYFYKDVSRKDGHMSACKECDSKKSNKWFKANPEKAAEKTKRWAAANPDKIKARAKNYYHNNIEKQKIKSKLYRENNKDKIKDKYLHKYGINIDQYNKMYVYQNGCCAICGTHQDAFSRSLHVDHCHDTGEVRGLLCFQCNTAIGKLNDDVSLVLKAAAYLTNPPNRAKDVNE